jgi:hypothetical protein
MSIFLSMVDLVWKHWRGVALIALLAVSAFVAHAWLAAHRSAAALAATLAVSQKQIDAAAADEKTRDAQLAAQIAQIAALEKKVQTPQQALAALPGALPPLPQPITLSSSAAPASTAPATSSAQAAGAGNQSAGGANAATAAKSGDAQTAASPGSPSGNSGASASPAGPTDLAPIVANIPQADLKPLYDYLENCEATTLDDATARKDLTDEQTQVTALTKERDAAVSSAKGGGFWTRFRRGAKWCAIGAATGAIAGAVAAHR